MAFISRVPGGFVVQQGNTGKTLKTFSGDNARRRAQAFLDELHRKNNPKASNRGASARRRSDD